MNHDTALFWTAFLAGIFFDRIMPWIFRQIDAKAGVET